MSIKTNHNTTTTTIGGGRRGICPPKFSAGCVPLKFQGRKKWERKIMKHRKDKQNVAKSYRQLHKLVTQNN